MAKLAFSKLDLKKNTNVVNIHFNDQIIEVKDYLPVNEKASLAAEVLNYTLNNNDNHFANPIQMEVFTVLGIIQRYTNITFTEKQKEDPAKLYDLFVGSGLWEKIQDAIPKEEYHAVIKQVNKSVSTYFEYLNSIFGILDTINKDYNDMNLEATEIQQKLADPNNMALVREVLTKLG